MWAKNGNAFPTGAGLAYRTITELARSASIRCDPDSAARTPVTRRTWQARGCGTAPIRAAPGVSSKRKSPGARLMRSNVEQLRKRLTGLGLVSRRDLRRYCELLENPDFSFSLPPMVCGRGRRAPAMSARRPKSG